MILRWLLLSLSVVVLSPNLLCAQSSLPPFPLARESSANPSANHKMYEDIEILRRILDRKLHPLYPRNTPPSMGSMGMGGMSMMGMGGMGMSGMGMMGMSGMGMMGMSGMGMMGMSGMGGRPMWTQEVGHPLEGVYLKGQGIIYTATLSSLQLSTKAETAKPVSEWESVRRQLHNKKESSKRPEASKLPELSEVVLKVLAENGHHFAQLGDNESLTIVFTVRGTSPSSPVQKPARDSATQKSRPSAGDGGDSDLSSSKRDLELLGDLHLKQGHYDEAIVAFAKAVELIRDSRAKADLNSVDDSGPKQVAALRRKLAQCYLMKGQDEKARTELNQAIVLLKEATDAKDKPVPASKPAAAALPIKLIISVSKKLLGQAGERKITFDEFRRRARVEMFTFDDGRP